MCRCTSIENKIYELPNTVAYTRIHAFNEIGRKLDPENKTLLISECPAFGNKACSLALSQTFRRKVTNACSHLFSYRLIRALIHCILAAPTYVPKYKQNFSLNVCFIYSYRKILHLIHFHTEHVKLERGVEIFVLFNKEYLL